MRGVQTGLVRLDALQRDVLTAMRAEHSERDSWPVSILAFDCLPGGSSRLLEYLGLAVGLRLDASGGAN
jgi:hypothetical protein